jgi:hypothetical protein
MKSVLISFVVMFLLAACDDAPPPAATVPVAPATVMGLVASEVVSMGGGYRLSVAHAPTPIPQNQVHGWTVHLADSTGRPVIGAQFSPVSGGMSMHGHGLPTQPEITRELGNGDYQLEGLKFHMAGRWELHLPFSVNGVQDSATLLLDLP